jgi:hypothetical protein
VSQRVKNFSSSTPKQTKLHSLNIEEEKHLHTLYIKELYKDRKAPVIPFDRNLIQDTCSNCLDNVQKQPFIKQ